MMSRSPQQRMEFGTQEGRKTERAQPATNAHINNQQSGFSLVEIVLALGVVAFSVIAILGLFPVALDAARESQRQTTATLIAQTVFSELKTTGSTSTAGAISWKIRNNATSDQWTDLATGAEKFAADFNTNVTSPVNAVFGARLKPQLVTSGSGLVQMNVNIETPMLSATGKRTVYTFTTLIAP